MSVVAAKVYPNRVEIAADSILVFGASKRTDNFTKLVKEGDLIIGGCGNAEELSIMWSFIANHRPLDASVKGITDFIIEFSIQKAQKLNMPPQIQNQYLIIYEGHLFEIEGYFVHEIENYVAIGAGADFATAALYLSGTPEQAVQTAAALSCFVAQPIVQYVQYKGDAKE